MSSYANCGLGGRLGVPLEGAVVVVVTVAVVVTVGVDAVSIRDGSGWGVTTAGCITGAGFTEDN